MEAPSTLTYTEIEKKPKKDEFWAEDPNILFSPRHAFQFFPTHEMTFYENLNAISRSVIIITVFSFLYTQNARILVIGAITLGSIYMMYYYTTLQKKKEPFSNPYNSPDLAAKLKTELKDELVFDKPSSVNPFSNLLISDIDTKPNKLPAPPTFDDTTEDDIIESAKKMVMEQNASQPDIADKLFRDLGDKYLFEQSLQPFYSNPSTTLPNDQAAFAQFCYGDMISCKEGNKFACARNLERYTN